MRKARSTAAPPAFGLLAPLALAAALLLAACGGGGGDGASAPPPPLPPVPPQPAAISSTPCSNGQIPVGTNCVTLGNRAPVSEANSLRHLNSFLGFRDQPALRAVNAHHAFGMLYRESYTGDGVLVAVVDSGIQHHEVFRDASGGFSRLTRIHEVEYQGPNLVGESTISVSRTPLRDDAASCRREHGPYDYDRYVAVARHCLWGADHGTAVASILAGSKHDSLLGIAPRADLVDVPFFRFMEAYCLRIPNQCHIFAKNEVQLPIFRSVFGAVANLDPKPRFVNASLTSYLYLPLELPDSAEHQERVKDWFVQLGGEVFWEEAQDTTNGAVYAFAAGNDYSPRYPGRRDGDCMFTPEEIPNACGDNPAINPLISGILPLIPEWIGTTNIPKDADLSPAMLAVVSVDVGGDGAPGTISSFSNHCGAAADWCIAAPGGHFSGTSFPAMKHAQGNHIASTLGYQRGNGTSYATPMVVGAMALVDEAFRAADGTPQVSPHEVRRRILDTANDSAPYDNPAIYGHGLLDVQAALTPQGMMSVPSPPSIGSSVSPLRGAGVPAAGLGLALPDAAVQGLAGGKIMVLDGHGFPFYLDAGRVAYAPSPGPGLSPAALTAGRAGPSYLGNLGFSLGEAGDSWGGAMAPEYALDGAAGQHSQLAAGAHLAVSPLVAASLDGGDTRHMAMRLRLGGSTLSAMACSQRRQTAQLEHAWHGGANDASSCMALGWDYAAGQSFGLSLRAHRLYSGSGLYRYGLRCFGASCGHGGASASELGIGGFAKLAPGLRLGWNYWQGKASDNAGGQGIIDYRNMGHRAGSIALQDTSGRWSLYVQQPLRATGAIALTLPSHRTPARQIHYRTHSFDLASGHHPLRLGFSGKLPLGGGLLALDLGTEGNLASPSSNAPYLHLQALVSW